MVTLVDRIVVHEGKRIGIVFKYRDEYKEISSRRSGVDTLSLSCLVQFMSKGGFVVVS